MQFTQVRSLNLREKFPVQIAVNVQIEINFPVQIAVVCVRVVLRCRPPDGGLLGLT